MPKTGYKIKGRKCCKCGNKTYVLQGKELWFKYKIDKDGNYDKNGYWDNRSYLCYKCYQDIPVNYEIYRNKTRSMTQTRTGNLKIDSGRGKSLIDQAVVTKVLGIDDLNIKMDNFEYYIDASNEKYGKIDIKGSHFYLIEEIWRFSTRGNIICDTFILLGYNHDRTNIDFVWIVPNENWKNEIKIHKDAIKTSKYDRFKVDPKPYNDVYYSLMEHLKNKKYFGAEDIKKWLKM